MKVLEQDSLLMRILARFFDLMILNFLIILCSLPIVTIGASITAAHYTALKMHREEGTVIKNFLKSFKENFKQSTLLWFVLLLYGIVIAVDITIVYQMAAVLPKAIHIIVLGILLYSLFVIVWIFPLQARFVNGFRGILKMSFLCSIKYFMRSWYMVFLHSIPILWVSIFTIQTYWILILIGLSLPIFLSAKAYNKVFKTIEENTKQKAE